MNKSETYNRDVLGYYRIIGITPDTDENLAKQKYRERAKAWHPDHNSSDEAKENFQKLSVAYDIISNDDKRLTYDLLCSAYTSSNFPPMFSLKPYRNMEGKDDFNLKTVSKKEEKYNFLVYHNAKNTSSNILNNLHYSGTIKINVKENFIKICEDDTKEETLKQGLYV